MSEWKYCLNKLSQMFCKFRSGGVVRECIHESRKRNLETEREKPCSLTINRSRQRLISYLEKLDNLAY